MIYGIEFTILDLIWCVVAVAGVAFYGLTTNYKWISPKTLALWLVIKLLIGLGFTLFSVLSDIEFDGAGYFLGGQPYAGMIKDLISGNSFEYLTTYPFWWIDGRSTDRLCSLAGLFVVLTGGSFLGATSIACVFGAIGQLFMFRFFRERFPEVREVYFLPVLFHPSLMMWSGMLIKDTFGIFALGWAVYSLHCLLGRKQLVAFIPFALSVYIIYLFRSFIFLPLAAFSLFIVWDQVIIPYTNRRHQGGVLKILYFISATAACGAVIFVLVDKVGSNLLDDRRDGAETFSQIEAGSSFENVELSISPLGLLRMGLGTINSLLRPFPWDVRKPMQAAAAVENVVILYFVGLGLSCYMHRFSLRQREQFGGIFWGTLLVALIIGTGVGLFASNSGTISRYRIPMIPFLVAVPGLALGMADSFSRSARHLSRLHVGHQLLRRNRVGLK